ncbi:MAG: hypothetical protein ACD_44C00140G0003 [uncultured bacterium]|nr:MAG: hypothetical protein ACD_44C00140G0003 [uncultured bacterium]OGT15507.1 MAG: hypothetical protein A3B69_05935 [Gammaproteobacteria bacterium RIFCSPHIGHO2_02_FULL_38_33]OGT24207.1 MAG: hypothetical protein A2W47_07095 [Gammaproteobacteria bacterium RIFCSPHIGHO2_12_38_15]OGT67398.1 MAG: hypothetical protein A3I12_03580 [Gammaproteobacteria bacterium RIFCSPLOWO2_02_FULL_38_11]
MKTFSGKHIQVQYVTPQKESFLISLDKIKSLGYQAPSVRESLRKFVLNSLVEKERELLDYVNGMQG